jgi:hypothetical protein
MMKEFSHVLETKYNSSLPPKITGKDMEDADDNDNASMILRLRTNANTGTTIVNVPGSTSMGASSHCSPRPPIHRRNSSVSDSVQIVNPNKGPVMSATTSNQEQYQWSKQ